MIGKDKQYDLSPEEIRKVQKRAALRATLKREYLRQLTDPHRHGVDGYLFDPGVQRFMSMRATPYDRFRPTARGFFKYLGMVVIPIVGYAYILVESKRRFEEKCRRGEIPYEEREFKQFHFQ